MARPIPAKRCPNTLTVHRQDFFTSFCGRRALKGNPRHLYLSLARIDDGFRILKLKVRTPLTTYNELVI